MNYIAKRIKEIRKMYGLKQETLAEILHTNRVRISKLENGKTNLSFEEARIICKKYDISIETFIETADLSSKDYIKISSRYLKNPSISFEEKRDVLKSIHIKLENACFDEISKINVTKNIKMNENIQKSNKIDIERVIYKR